jgi:hypothetical protein
MILNEQDHPDIYSSLKEKCKKLGLDAAKVVPLGIHGDGVPFSKKESLELISFNFLSDSSGDRIPITGISKSFVCQCGCLGKHTWGDIMGVIAWSMRSLCAGKFPRFDPQGLPLVGKRTDLAEQDLGMHALLCQLRADWPFLKSLFSFPAWNGKDGICWMCPAAKDG